jgi:hypothetical protein
MQHSSDVNLSWQRRASDRPVVNQLFRQARMPMSFTEADKYRWLRANRANLDLAGLLHANCDGDFDSMLEAAMRTSVASPSYFGQLVDLD